MSDESHLVYADPESPTELLLDCELAGAAVASARRDLITHQHDFAVWSAAQMSAKLHLD